MAEFFPLILASGENFCNRVNERGWLADNIENCRHSLLMSPRRYGKTSLAQQVLHDTKTLYGNFDFLFAYDDVSVKDELLRGVGSVITQLVPVTTKAVMLIKKFMQSLRPEIIVSNEGARVTFTPSGEVKTTITEALLSLEKLAAHLGKSAVLFMDEFQQISTLKYGSVIEAAIRHAAERSRHICYIFSGSNRHLLADMFQDSERPLYHLCDELHLKRIDGSAYQKHLQKFAKKKWDAHLTEDSLQTILDVTRRHPFFVNQLCARLWREPQPPNVNDVIKTWDQLCDEQRSRIYNAINQLSPNQRAVFGLLAKHPLKEPTALKSQQLTRLTSTSLTQSLGVLKQKDYIYVDHNGITRPLNPIAEFIFSSSD